MMHEDGGQKDLEIKKLNEQNGILNEPLNERETRLDETLQRLADVDSHAIKPAGNKALLDQIEKPIQSQCNNMEIIFKNMIDEKFNSNVLNNGNRIVLYTSATVAYVKKRISENSIQETRINVR